MGFVLLALPHSLYNNPLYHFVITSIPIHEPNINCLKYLEEHLQFYLPLTHPLVKEKELSMNDLNGENMLILSNIGNWFHIPQKKMLASHFLIQEDYASLNELLKYSSIAPIAQMLFLRRLFINFFRHHLCLYNHKRLSQNKLRQPLYNNPL